MLIFFPRSDRSATLVDLNVSDLRIIATLLNTVSEGVETIDQLQALQALGADHIQGFLIARDVLRPYVK